MGVSAHADTMVTPGETTATTMVTTSNSGVTEATGETSVPSANGTQNSVVTEMTSDAAGSGTNGTPANPASEVPTGQAVPSNTGVTNTKVGIETLTRPAVWSIDTSVILLETSKPATAWQPEPTTNYSSDHTAKIDMTNQPTTVHGDNWQMSLDKNYIKAGQSATLTVKYEAQAGDTFVLDIGYPASVNAQSLNSQIGTTSTKDNGLRTQVTNVFKQAGTYTQIINLNGWKSSAEGLELLRHVFGDQAFDLTLKRGTSVENAQDVGRLYLTSSFTPTMTGTGSVGVDRIDGKYVPVLSTNNNYIFSVRTNWSDSGTILDPSYNGDFVYSISVPKTFELDQTATEAFYQQIRNEEPYYTWGNRGSNVTASQAGVGAPVVIKANALDWVGWHYGGNEGVSFLGHFVDAPSVATTVTAEGQTTVSDTIGGHTQTIVLPGLLAKVINAADYDYVNSGDTVFLVSDYGDHNQLYQSHEVPMTGNGNSISLINDLAVKNNSPFDVKNATVTLTFGDGLHVDVDSIRNNSYISNLLANDYDPNREKSLLVTYQDGTSETVPANSKGDPIKNIKSITLTRDWNAGQMAGMHIVGTGGGGIRGFVSNTYQNGSPVKIGDTINVSLTVAGVNAAGHTVSKTISDTLKVVNQQFAPLTTENLWGGVDKTSLGANPSGTINIHWKRTSGEHSKIQLENPTIYFVMPNTVAQVKNPRWGSGKDAQGNSAPTLTSITYEKSKDGKNMVAIMHFSGALIDQNSNNFVPLFFDTVNKDNVVNQQSEGYLYWTADNVNADGLTKIDPSRLDSQNKAAHLPADFSQEQLSKIYLHEPYWGTINMATGMYSTSATKTTTTPWQTRTIVDYHGDGQADVGVNLVNDTSNELRNVIAIINLPKASNNSNLIVNLTGNKAELIDPNTNSKLTDGVTVLYSTKSADLSSNDLSSFVTADQIKDWSKVQAVAVTLSTLGGMTSRQVQIPVVVKDLVTNAGKTGILETRVSTDELKPIIVTADAKNAAKLVVGGQATIHVQMHYQDAQGKDHYVPLADRTQAYDVLQGHVLNGSDFTPSVTDLAQVPGYELSKAAPTVVSGHAVIGQPVAAPDDGSVLQFELVPSAQKVLINYVDDDDNQKVIKTDTLTGKTGETQKINVVAPNNYVLVDPAANPSEYTFLASDNQLITIHLKHQHNITQEQKTVTRTIKVTQPDGMVAKQVQTVTLTRTATVDEVTSAVIKYGAWSTGQWDTYQIPSLKGYTASQTSVEATPVDENTKDQTVEVSYTPNKQSTTIKYVDDKGQTIHTTTVDGVTDQTMKVPNEVPAGWMITKGEVPSEITFGANGHEPVEVTVGHQHVSVDPDHPQNNGTKLPDNPAKTFEGVEMNDLNKTITRTIKVTTPDGQIKMVAQTAKLTRNADVDEVTGEVAYGAWSTSFWDNFKPKVIDGYTASQVDVPQTAVTSDTVPATVNITYTANAQTSAINYMINGEVIKSTSLNGVTDQTLTGLTYTAPDGYEIVEGQSLPTEYRFKANDNAPIVVQLVHKQQLVINFVGLDGIDIKGVAPVTVDGVTGQVVTVPKSAMPAGYQMLAGQNIPDTFMLNDNDDNYLSIIVTPIMVTVKGSAPVKTGDIIPNTNGAKYPAGLTQTDLIKTITRTIYIAKPDGKMGEVVQMVKFSRDATLNAATGEISYDVWVPSSRHDFEAYTPEVIDGFTVESVPSQVVTPESQYSEIMLTYKRIPQSKVPNYIDNQGHALDKIPDGYHVVPGQVTDKGGQLVVKDHQVVVPKVEYVTRTITMTMPNGKTRTITQRVRKGTKFVAAHLPHLRGYTAELIIGGTYGATDANSDVAVSVRFVKSANK